MWLNANIRNKETKRNINKNKNGMYFTTWQYPKAGTFYE